MPRSFGGASLPFWAGLGSRSCDGVGANREVKKARRLRDGLRVETITGRQLMSVVDTGIGPLLSIRPIVSVASCAQSGERMNLRSEALAVGPSRRALPCADLPAAVACIPMMVAKPDAESVERGKTATRARRITVAPKHVSGPQKGFLDGIDHHFRLFDHQEMSTIGHVFDRVVVIPACDEIRPN